MNILRWNGVLSNVLAILRLDNNESEYLTGTYRKPTIPTPHAFRFLYQVGHPGNTIVPNTPHVRAGVIIHRQSLLHKNGGAYEHAGGLYPICSPYSTYLRALSTLLLLGDEIYPSPCANILSAKGVLSDACAICGRST